MMDDDELMDLLSRPMYDRKPTRPQAKSDISLEQSQAPIDLMSKFLMFITENKMKEALALGREILIYEPDNRIILEYQNALKDYIDQGLDLDSKLAEEKLNDDDDEEEEDDDDDEDEEDDDDDEESEEEGEGKTMDAQEFKSNHK